MKMNRASLLSEEKAVDTFWAHDFSMTRVAVANVGPSDASTFGESSDNEEAGGLGLTIR